MKTYEGKRSIDGLQVTVDGRPLPEHYEIKQFTTWGFEWTYIGDSPRQLALAILYDYLGDGPRAVALSERALGEELPAVHLPGGFRDEIHASNLSRAILLSWPPAG